MNDTAPLGHNMPPAQAEELHQRLADDYAHIMARGDDLLAAAARAPDVVTDDNAGRIGDFVKQIAAEIKALNAARVNEKEPYLAGGRTVDGFFKAIADPLTKAKKTIEARVGAYLRERADQERREREEVAKIAREEAAKVAEEAAKIEAAMTNDADVEGAIEAEKRAKETARIAAKAKAGAEARAADLAKSRGDYGSVASLRTTWEFEIDDIRMIPFDVLRAHISRDAIEKAIRSYIKVGGRDLAGVRIFETTHAVVR